MAHFIVVGGGQAAASLVARLRSDGFDGAITLVCAEPVPPYQRPPLSKAYLLGEMEQARLYLRPEAWYVENDITLRLGTRCVGIDPEARTVMLQGEELLSYDELALTTGSHPRLLPAAIGGDLEGVHAMRDLRDADTLAPQMRPGRRLLVIGGGYIGLEAAAVAAKKGLQVTLIEMADRILQRVACPETSAFFRDLHRAHGVDIREGLGLTRLTGTDHVSGAELSDGSTLEVDFAVVGIGIAPATILADSAGIVCDNGIATDAQGRTSAPHVWAAGDCASFPHGGGRIRLESVGNAIDQAEIVARNMMGGDLAYDARPWFWSDQYECKLQIAGLNTGYDTVHVKRGEGAAVSHWYYRGDQLLAVDAMNDARTYMVAKRLIEMGKSPAPSVVLDPETNMKALLKA
ncbi:MAG: ferredoxin--NAD+ reductase [Rhodobacteraceae bacterium HLUCCA08]|nr:MAG: ferredoxin--NAD+ reductase [Rhodobacteraceae bacterium HLUCCA08]